MVGFKVKIYTLLVCLVSLLAVVSCSKDDGSFKISGKLENVTGDRFYISHEVGDSLFVDTIHIDKDGKFSYRAKVDTITVMSLYFNQNTRNTFLLVDKNWDVKLKGDMLYPDLIEVKGGDVNDDITEFKNKNKELLQSRADILHQAELANQTNDSLPVTDYVVELKNINFELSNLAATYIKTHPDKIASVMLISIFFKDEATVDRLEENLALLTGKAKDFPLTEDLTAFKDKIKLSAVGSFAPYFSIKNLKGKNIQLSSFRDKYVLLSFAATTCETCREEKAEAIEVYNELKKQKKNIEFITIVKDIEQIPISKNLSDSVKWDVLPVEGGWGANVFDTYYIREIPYHILISPTGYILSRDITFRSLPQKLEEEINKTSKN